MWRNWFIGILGLWILVLAFLGFPPSVKRILMIVTGIAISAISFWRGVSETIIDSIRKNLMDVSVSADTDNTIHME